MMHFLVTCWWLFFLIAVASGFFMIANVLGFFGWVMKEKALVGLGLIILGWGVFAISFILGWIGLIIAAVKYIQNSQ